MTLKSLQNKKLKNYNGRLSLFIDYGSDTYVSCTKGPNYFYKENTPYHLCNDDCDCTGTRTCSTYKHCEKAK